MKIERNLTKTESFEVLKEVKIKQDDLWSRSDSESKYNLINYAIRKGIK